MLKRLSVRNGHLAALYALQQAEDGLYSAGADGFIVHWHRDDVDFGRVVAKVEGGKFFSLATLEDGGLIAGALDGGVHWLYPEAPERNLHVAHHARAVYDVFRFHNDLYTAGGDGRLTRWDVTTRRTVESVRVSNNSLRCIAHDPVNDRLAVGASDGNVYLLARHQLAVSGVLPANGPSVFCAAFSADGKQLVTGGRDACLQFFDSAGTALAHSPLAAHQSTVNSLAFSPGGEFLATTSRDKTVKLWRAEDGTYTLLKVAEVVRDAGHVNSVNCLLWLDDKTLFTAGDDRRILEWRVG